MLDTKNRLLAFHGVSTGTLSATLVHPRLHRALEFGVG